MDNTAACSGFCREKKKNVERKGQPRAAEGGGGRGGEGKNIYIYFFLLSDLTLSPLFSLPPLVEKSWRVFLAFSSPAARWKGWPYTALHASMSFFILSVSLLSFLSSLYHFFPSPILPSGHSHRFHFIHTFPHSLDSFPAPPTTA